MSKKADKKITERKIVKRETITDQVDPRMIEFRESRGEFEPGCKQKTVRLEITEYEPSPDNIKIVTKFGHYEGEPPPSHNKFFRRLFQSTFGKDHTEKQSDD